MSFGERLAHDHSMMHGRCGGQDRSSNANVRQKGTPVIAGTGRAPSDLRRSGGSQPGAAKRPDDGETSFPHRRWNQKYWAGLRRIPSDRPSAIRCMIA